MPVSDGRGTRGGTHDLGKDALEEDLHDNCGLRKDGGDDLRLLADCDPDLVVQIRQARFGLGRWCFRIWQ